MINKELHDFLGNSEVIWPVFGIVEDNADPLTLGRVKVRWFGYHTDDKSEIPTKDLPWCTVMQPTTSASVSGVGWSPNGLLAGTMVVGAFMDGKYAQHPLVMGTIPTIHKPSSPSNRGNSGAGYVTEANLYSGDATPGPYHGSNFNDGNTDPGPLPNDPGSGGAIKDTGRYLTNQDKSNWPLKIYKPTPSNGDTGLACKDGMNSLRIHYASVLALEELSKQLGKTFKINSAYRTPPYNARIGGAGNSMHTHGRAFDIDLGSIGNLQQFVQAAVKCGFVGFGLYNTFIHIDTGTGRVWNGAATAQFTSWLKTAGWYSGKPGLSDIKTQPGDIASSNNTSSNNSVSSSTPRNAVEGKATAYSPQRPGSSTSGLEGGYQSSTTGPDGTNLVRTLEDYRTGKSSYVTGAGNSAYYGNSYNVSNITYTNAQGQTYTLTDVPVVIHDTGSAFKNASEGRYDIAVDKDMSQSLLNSQQFTAQPISFQPSYTNKSSGNSRGMPGFYDPSNSLPYGEYQGKPSTNQAAKGINANLYQPKVAMDVSYRLGSYPAAGDIGTFGAPESARAPQYPFNTVYASLSGHMMEFDDTPGSERVNIEHKTGTKYEVNPGGTRVERVSGNAYQFYQNASYTAVDGDNFVTTVGDYRLKTTSDMCIHADGSIMILSHNDRAEIVAGEYKVLAGETIRIKANMIIIESPSIHVYSTGEMNLEAEGELNIKAKGINIESTDQMSIKSKEAMKVQTDSDYSLKADNAVKMESGEGFSIKGMEIKQEADADFSVKSSSFKSESSVANIKAGSTKISGSKISLTGKTHTNSLYTNELFSPAPTEEPAVPESPDSAISVEAPDDANSAKEAKSADLGSPGSRKTVEKSKVVKSHPDAVKTASESSNYYGEAGDA